MAEQITIWRCKEPGCTYWRDERSSGVHQFFPNRGGGVVHELESRPYLPASEVRELVDRLEKLTIAAHETAVAGARKPSVNAMQVRKAAQRLLDAHAEFGFTDHDGFLPVEEGVTLQMWADCILPLLDDLGAAFARADQDGRAERDEAEHERDYWHEKAKELYKQIEAARVALADPAPKEGVWSFAGQAMADQQPNNVLSVLRGQLRSAPSSARSGALQARGTGSGGAVGGRNLSAHCRS